MTQLECSVTCDGAAAAVADGPSLSGRFDQVVISQLLLMKKLHLDWTAQTKAFARKQVFSWPSTQTAASASLEQAQARKQVRSYLDALSGRLTY